MKWCHLLSGATSEACGDMIHLLHQPASAQQMREMQEVHETYIKVAVDIQRGVLVGGGEFHADCESVLVEDGSRREDIWGADWIPTEHSVRFGALINIRLRINPNMEIQDQAIRRQVEAIMRKLLHGAS